MPKAGILTRVFLFASSEITDTFFRTSFACKSVIYRHGDVLIAVFPTNLQTHFPATIHGCTAEPHFDWDWEQRRYLWRRLRNFSERWSGNETFSARWNCSRCFTETCFIWTLCHSSPRDAVWQHREEMNQANRGKSRACKVRFYMDVSEIIVFKEKKKRRGKRVKPSSLKSLISSSRLFMSDITSCRNSRVSRP